jgi:hypothetical protein
MGLLGRLQVGLPGKRVPGDVLATAKTLKHSVPARWQKRAPAWAAAALLVLGLGVLPQIYSIRQDSQVLLPATGGVEPPGKLRETRGINPMATGPRFLSLAEDLDAIPEGYLFRWTPVPDSRFYQVRIVSDSGDLLWQERITGTEWKIPAGTHLTPGTEYFVRVEAFLADTRSLKSVYLPFQVEEHR